MIRHYETKFYLRTLIGSLFNERYDRIIKFFGDKIGGEIVLTSSGSSAIFIALKDIERRYGLGKIITSNYSCKAIPRAIIKAGFEPIFMDVDKDMGMNPKFMEMAIKENQDVRGIIAWHPEGFVFNKKIVQIAKKHHLPLIEDCASSLALVNENLVGKTGDYAIFSFRTGKLIHGGGGVLISKHKIDIKLKKKNFFLIAVGLGDLFLRKFLNIKKIKAISDHFFDHPGFKIMSKPESFIVYSQLKNIGVIREKRKYNYDYLSRFGIKGQLKLDKAKLSPCPTSLVLLRDNRNNFISLMKRRGIEMSKDHTHINSEVFPGKVYGIGNSKFISERVCHLPVHEFLLEDDLKKIVKSVKEIDGQRYIL